MSLFFGANSCFLVPFALPILICVATSAKIHQAKGQRSSAPPLAAGQYAALARVGILPVQLLAPGSVEVDYCRTTILERRAVALLQPWRQRERLSLLANIHYSYRCSQSPRRRRPKNENACAKCHLSTNEKILRLGIQLSPYRIVTVASFRTFRTSDSRLSAGHLPELLFLSPEALQPREKANTLAHCPQVASSLLGSVKKFMSLDSLSSCF